MFIIAVPAVAVGTAEGARVARKGSNGRLTEEAGDGAGVSEYSSHVAAERATREGRLRGIARHISAESRQMWLKERRTQALDQKRLFTAPRGTCHRRVRAVVRCLALRPLRKRRRLRSLHLSQAPASGHVYRARAVCDTGGNHPTTELLHVVSLRQSTPRGHLHADRRIFRAIQPLSSAIRTLQEPMDRPGLAVASPSSTRRTLSAVLPEDHHKALRWHVSCIFPVIHYIHAF